PHQWTACARIDLRFGFSGKLTDLARILFRERKRHVAGNGRDAEDFQFGARQRQQYGHRIVLARIGIYDDFPRPRHALRSPTDSLNWLRKQTISRARTEMPSRVFVHPRRSSRTEPDDAHDNFLEPASSGVRYDGEDARTNREIGRRLSTVQY